jgi:hypothetical protein
LTDPESEVSVAPPEAEEPAIGTHELAVKIAISDIELEIGGKIVEETLFYDAEDMRRQLEGRR